MKFIYANYMPNQFAILPAIGVIKSGTVSIVTLTVLALYGDFGVSVLA